MPLLLHCNTSVLVLYTPILKSPSFIYKRCDPCTFTYWKLLMQDCLVDFITGAKFYFKRSIDAPVIAASSALSCG